MKAKTVLPVCAAAAIVPVLFAAETWELPLDEPQLKTAPGVEAVSANCQICHSADYVSTQPPLNRVAWTAIVQKMREKYGAPLPPGQTNEIIDYLAANYGKK
jgi:hypothetical protein